MRPFGCFKVDPSFPSLPAVASPTQFPPKTDQVKSDHIPNHRAAIIQVNRIQLIQMLPLDCQIQRKFSGFGNPLRATL